MRRESASVAVTSVAIVAANRLGRKVLSLAKRNSLPVGGWLNLRSPGPQNGSVCIFAGARKLRIGSAWCNGLVLAWR
jgi:hypothetical protein